MKFDIRSLQSIKKTKWFNAPWNTGSREPEDVLRQLVWHFHLKITFHSENHSRAGKKALCVNRNQNCYALTVFLHQSEGFCVPTVINIGRLDIKMAVDAHSLLAWVWPQTPQDNGWQRDLLSGGELNAQTQMLSHNIIKSMSRQV